MGAKLHSSPKDPALGGAPTFTVFTPSFNRASFLPKVYECLSQQSFKDFEWLIVDDGSTDGTEELVRGWCNEKRLDIAYYHQANQGKHVAFNRGVELARGALFLPLDSDDTCTPDAIERLLHNWYQIPEGQRDLFSGITCLCKDEHGCTVGSPFPADVMDGYPVEFLASHRITGEKWGFCRLDVLRAFPFPENAGERFVPEGLVWNRIGKQFKMRFINEALRIYEPLPDGLSGSLVKLRSHNPVSTCVYYLERSKFAIPWKERGKSLANYVRFYFHSKRNASSPVGRFEMSPHALLMLPIGYAFYVWDRLRS